MIDVHPMRDGFALRLDLGDPLQRAMAAQRRYESDVTWVYPYLLRRGDRVVDGGAHIGYLTLLASRCVGPSGEVHAFEPVPRTFAALGENVRLNRATNVRTNRVALAARAGELELEVPIDPEGEGLLAWGATSVRLRRGPIERAPAMTLDEYARGYGFDRIALLKLDLEGAELDALRGMDEPRCVRTIRAGSSMSSASPSSRCPTTSVPRSHTTLARAGSRSGRRSRSCAVRSSAFCAGGCSRRSSARTASTGSSSARSSSSTSGLRGCSMSGSPRSRRAGGRA